MGTKMSAKINLILIHLFTLIMVLIAIGPFVFVILTAFKDEKQIWNSNELIPSYITMDNFKNVLLHSYFVRYFCNSIFIAVVTTLICMVIAVMAAYGFTRYHIFGDKQMKLLILMTRMFPGILLCVPFYVIMKKFGLIDSYIGLIMMYCSFTLPFAIWNMCAFFKQMPWELEEAAFIDGCNRFTAFFKVIYHVAKPGFFVTCLFTFMSSWDEYMYSLIFITSRFKKTIQVGMSDFVGQYSTNWGLLMAAVVLSLIPVLLAFSFVQKNLVQGLSAGAVKG